MANLQRPTRNIPMTTQAPAKRVHITTFGCQMNEYDSGRLADLLADLGYQPAARPQEADLILVNTCSVRQRAEHKIYSLIGSLKELKHHRPGLIIGVGGCVAQQEGQRLLDQIPHLDLVFGTRTLERLPELLQEAQKGRRRALTDLASVPRPPAPPPLLQPGAQGPGHGNGGLRQLLLLLCSALCARPRIQPSGRGNIGRGDGPDRCGDAGDHPARTERQLLPQSRAGPGFPGSFGKALPGAKAVAHLLHHQPPQGPLPPPHGGHGRSG
ncbi:hypothetical protein DFAR_2570012 [Desulfarculales bacterium]